MPAQKVALNTVELGEAANRFLDTKTRSTKTAYKNCLRRFRYFYEKPLEKFIEEYETETEANKSRGIAERVRPCEQTLRRFVQWHIDHGYSNNATRQSMAALQNFMKYYGITISYDFIELPPPIPMKENEKHMWTLDQMREFIDTAEYLRDKAFIAVAFQSGLSIGDILDLNYGDIRRELEAGTMPLMIHTYRKKTGVEIKTFIGRDALYYLRLYLASRKDLKDSAPIFTMLGSRRRASKQAIQRQLREYAARLKFIYDEDLENGYNPARPHSLRSAFRSRLTGKMDGDLIEFFMGHDIGTEKKAYLNMPEDELRELYANHEHLLAIEKTSLDERIEAQGPRVTEKALDELAERVAELTRENVTMKAELGETRNTLEAREERLSRLEERWTVFERALAHPEAGQALWKALRELEEKAEAQAP